MIKRLTLIIIIGATGAAFGWIAAIHGIGQIAIPALALVLALLIGLFNTTPFLFKPDGRYGSIKPERVRWPEALPIEPSGRHERLVFCVHGFPSTPADYRKIMAASEARLWDVAAPLLPGCGTDPSDFLSTEWSQYLAAVRDEWKRLRPHYKTACVVGTSMGGALALALAEETCGDPDLAPAAIATIGAPVVLNAWLRYGIVTNPLIYAARFLGSLVPSMGAKLPDPERRGEDGDGDWKGYLGVYTKQTYSLQVGLRAMERRLSSVTCPAIVCHARGDKMVDFRNSGILMGKLGSQSIAAYIANMDGAGHMKHNLMLYDSQRDRAWSRILDFFEAETKR